MEFTGIVVAALGIVPITQAGDQLELIGEFEIVLGEEGERLGLLLDRDVGIVALEWGSIFGLEIAVDDQAISADHQVVVVG